MAEGSVVGPSVVVSARLQPCWHTSKKQKWTQGGNPTPGPSVSTAQRATGSRAHAGAFLLPACERCQRGQWGAGPPRRGIIVACIAPRRRAADTPRRA